jgi:hypothetical protein
MEKMDETTFTIPFYILKSTGVAYVSMDGIPENAITAGDWFGAVDAGWAYSESDLVAPDTELYVYAMKGGKLTFYGIPDEADNKIIFEHNGSKWVERGKGIPLLVGENGIYTPPDGVDGFSSVLVDVVHDDTALQEKIAKYELVTNTGLKNFVNCADFKQQGDNIVVNKIVDKTITTLVIPNNAKFSDDYNCLSGCNNLESITIPYVGAYDSAIDGKYPWYTFGRMFNDKIDKDTTYMAEQQYCTKTTIYGSKEYDYHVWYIPTSLKSVTVTGGNIVDYAFYRCSNITDIILSDGVTSIGDYAFRYCTGLKNITIPNSVTDIGRFVFGECTSLASITIPHSVTKIPSEMFSGCSRLVLVTIPDSVTAIGDSAFRGCSAMREFTIPDGVTSIEDGVFKNCSNLQTIRIPRSVTTISSDALWGCNRLVYIYYSGTEEEWNAINKIGEWDRDIRTYCTICYNA